MPATSILPRARSFGDPVHIHVGGRPVAALLHEAGRLRVGLVMHPLDRVVDVSVQPAAVVTTLQGAATACGQPWDAVAQSARAALVEAHERFGSRCPRPEEALLASVGGAAFPLLGSAYDAGAHPLEEVPRWAAPILEGPTVRHGATAAFAERATRPVVRSLVAAIAPDGSGHVGLGSLALALIGRDVLEPDRLARVLAAERAVHPAGDLPDPSTLDLARAAVATWGPARAERCLTDAAADEAGVRLILASASYQRQLRGHGPATLPNRLHQVHDLLRARIATAPPPPPPPPPPAPRRPAVPAAARFADQIPRDPTPAERLAAVDLVYAPPRDLRPVIGATLLSAPPAVAAVDGQRVEDLTLVLPRTAADLLRWGRLLANCLGEFGPAVAAGRSSIIGVERSGALAFAIEVGAERAIHQFTGLANRRPDPRTRALVVLALADAGVIDRAHPRNAPWLEAAEEVAARASTTPVCRSSRRAR
ncbi:MAG: hypothetical protein U0P45_07875 [Acidimicrobiales bacterium]